MAFPLGFNTIGPPGFSTLMPGNHPVPTTGPINHPISTVHPINTAGMPLGTVAPGTPISTVGGPVPLPTGGTVSGHPSLGGSAGPGVVGGIPAPPPATVFDLLTGGVKQSPGGTLQGAAERTPDEMTASAVAEHLASALAAAKDPNLRESLSTALAGIHKHLAGAQKERHQALQGKLSARLLEQLYGPAHQQAAKGHYAQAAQMWEQHHPYAVTHGNIPAFVSQWIQQAQQATNPQAATNAPAGTPTAY